MKLYTLPSAQVDPYFREALETRQTSLLTSFQFLSSDIQGSNKIYFGEKDLWNGRTQAKWLQFFMAYVSKNIDD